METEYERSRLERAKRELYDPHVQDSATPPKLSKVEYDTSDEWKTHDDELLGIAPKSREMGVTFVKLMIISAVLAVATSIGYLAYAQLMRAKNSPENIIMVPNMPVSVTSGATNDLRLSIENKNPSALEGVVLTVKFPPGTRKPGGKEELVEEKRIFGTIESGASVEWQGAAAFFGRENANLPVEFSIDYRFEGISSTFERSVPRNVRVTTAPLSVTIDTLGEVSSGQTTDMTIVVTSNTTVPLFDLALRMEFPQGFQLLDAEPVASVGDATWSIGKLEPGEKYLMRLRGVLSGEEGEKRAFRAIVGPGDPKSAFALELEYANVLREISLRKSFIGVELFLDGKPAGDTIGNFGRTINGSVAWKNNLPVRILDAQIEVKLSGSALDRRSIKASNGGFYRSIDDTIIWEQRNTPELSVLEIGEQGNVEFSFLPLPSVTGGEILRNPTITAEITVRGKRVLETGVPEEVRTISVRTVRVTSEAQFVSRAIHTFGPIVNRGPIPPKVDQETTYTVVWSIINSANDIRGATVRAVLPPYARFTGTVLPFGENVMFNETTKEVVWTAGDIPAGTGVSSKPREVYFQVAILPSLSQIGSAPEILYAQKFVAQDAFTGAQISQQRESLTTALPNDPNISREETMVVP